MQALTAQRLRSLFHYDAETGVFTRAVATGNRGCNKAGEVAGGMSGGGYCVIGVDGQKYMAHRLAWLYVHGCWPVHQIDHINGVRHDNRLCNLRDVPQAINVRNLRAAKSNNATSKYLGVSFDKFKRKWKACISVNGKQLQLGRFCTEQQARDAYRAAKPAIHGVEVAWPK